VVNKSCEKLLSLATRLDSLASRPTTVKIIIFQLLARTTTQWIGRYLLLVILSRFNVFLLSIGVLRRVTRSASPRGMLGKDSRDPQWIT